jgi:hypothetical protein
MASSAFAVAEEEAATWRTGESGTALTGSETVSSTGSGELVTTVGETPLVLKSTGMECIECKIENSGGKAVGSGKLKFTGVTVSTPATCAVSGGAVTTLALTFTWFYMGTWHPAGGGSFRWWWLWIHPNSGTTFATVTLKEGSGSCPLAGSYIVSGNVFAHPTNETGAYAKEQTVTSSGTLNAEGGGELKFGTKNAELNGTGTFALSGAKKGSVFGVLH